jgi:nitrate/TMAO reductase-like tetraheme cytochrome c subunit
MVSAQRLRTALLAAALPALLVAAAAVRDRTPWPLRAPAPVPDGRPAQLARAKEVACGECHAPQLEDWSRTTHALAWENEPYQEDLEGRKKAESCHGCHAPERLHGAEDALLAGKPAARADERHLGVSCESCHMAHDGALLGPTGAPTDKHATRKGASFVGSGSNALCAACHRTTVGPVIGLARDFEQSKAAEAGTTCVDCHMAIAAEVGEGEAKRAVRSHALQTPRDPAFLALGFEYELSAESSAVRLVIHNKAGHRVPGLIGRELEFRARAFAADGKELGRETLTLTTESYLPVDDSVILELPAATAVVQLEGWHHDPRLDKPVRFVERELAAR